MNINSTHKIIQTLNEELELLKAKFLDVFNLTEKAIGLCSLALLEMKEIIRARGFSDDEEEIHFFKQLKPKVYSKLLYFHKLYEIETKRPKAKLLQRKYLNRVLKILNRYFEQNFEIYQYYLGKQEHNDALYFLRKHRNVHIHPETIFSYIDNEFSTLQDYTFSSIMAHEELVKYIENKISQLEQIELRGKNNASSDFLVTTGIKWTGSKISLVELIYALYSTNSINNGNISLKELVKLTEQLLNIELGDYSRGFLDIRMRKTERTKFLDSLKQSLLKRMEDADE